MSFHPKIPYDTGPHKSERELPETGAPFAFTPERRARLEEITTHYPPDQRRSAVLPALHLVQQQQGHITATAMRHVADVIGCTPAEVEDVVSFYTMFFTKPVGKYVVQVCRTLPCALRGAERVTEALEQRLHLKVGQTDPSGTFTLLEVECLGACDRAPVIMVNDVWQEGQRPEAVGDLIDRLRTQGEQALTGCHLDVERAKSAKSR